MHTSFRIANPKGVAAGMVDARSRTLHLFENFVEAGLEHPRAGIADGSTSPRWELGHIAWFAEWFGLRGARTSEPAATQNASMLSRGDDWFDPSTRSLKSLAELPAAGALKMYCREVLERVVDKLGRVRDDDDALYPYRLALAYEDMWGERWMQACQILDLKLPAAVEIGTMVPWAQGEISFPGSTILLGSEHNQGFAFDNECWAYRHYVPPFEMDSSLVTNAQFQEFVEDGGYQFSSWWSTAGRSWLVAQGRCAPRHWRRSEGKWHCFRFGEERALQPREPVMHLNLYEAQAYCRWTDRRLPTEAEWECAATSGHPAFRWGDLWEWTDTPFEPYPDFEVGAWRNYSAPYFGQHQVLRGASFVTPQRLRSPKFRAFRWPTDDTLFAGFRTCRI